MAEHLSNDEEIEMLKRWWKESGQQLAVLVLVAVVGYFGWNGWQEHRQQQAELASVLYQEMMGTSRVGLGSPLTDEQRAQITYLAVSLQDEHSGSQYAQHASLMLARLAVEQNDLDTAAMQLRTVMNDADEGLSLVARLRLARVEAAREKFDEALELLDDVDAQAMSSVYSETRGDFYLLQGETDLAYTAYKTALDNLDERDSRARPLLELKLNQVLPQTEAVTEITEEEV